MRKMKELNRKIHLSFFAKLYISFAVISIVPVLSFSILAYTFSFRNFMVDLKRQANTILENSMTNLEHTIEEYEMAISYFSLDEEVIDILTSHEDFEQKRTKLYQKMYILLAGKAKGVTMHVIKADGSFNLSTSFLPEMYDVQKHSDWGIFRELNRSDSMVVYPNHFTSSFGKTFCMTIAHNIKKNGQIIGYCIIDIPENVFQSVFTSSGSLQSVSYTVIDQNYYILYDQIFNTGDKFLSSEFRNALLSSKSSKSFYLEKPKRLIAWNEMEKDIPFIVILSVPVDLVEMNNNYIVLTTLIVGTVAILLCLALSPVIVRALTRPLNEIVNVMKKVQQGDTNARVPMQKDDEFGFIADNFNRALDNMNTLYETNLEKQNRLRISEIKALHAQINPHFLYNTLDSIKWLAKLNGVEDIVVMVSQLGRLLKNSINNQKDTIPIREEINLVKSYLSIQKIRYGDKFEVDICVDEDIMECVVPKFIIQPLVENAIIHGIENKIGNAKLIIKGTKQRDTIIFEIMDDGIGMNEEELMKLKQMDYKTDDHKDSIGIKNVDKRIKLYYGQEYGLDIQSKKNVGTTTRIIMPFMPKKEDERGGTTL
ncbi:MAG: two-component system, sensor histidine kinase YesM [Epulopiscium sp.]|jgi:two-component system sensor histidine kinase YesM|nr:two-component system, sensor histidine kinase YesM [Candidatus Epulonipiscium sp.]